MLQAELEFIIEIDKLKSILRKNKVCFADRNENSAEHSWQLAIMAIVLQKYSAQKIDINKVVQMLLIHDLVEIDAGDTFVYDEQARIDKQEAEAQAAQRLFSYLEEDLKQHFLNLWHEFEEEKTAEALFAKSMDRICPILFNIKNKGGSWKEFKIEKRQVLKRLDSTKLASPVLYDFMTKLLDQAEIDACFKHN